mmetsp:Transcript_19168/g.41475  ORF Transcript_19168/g.41475 Transcript_19168/m.41475 type:complete len:213 (+) Transcript_19168:826-1464(+)
MEDTKHLMNGGFVSLRALLLLLCCCICSSNSHNSKAVLGVIEVPRRSNQISTTPLLLFEEGKLLLKGSIICEVVSSLIIGVALRLHLDASPDRRQPPIRCGAVVVVVDVVDGYINDDAPIGRHNVISRRIFNTIKASEDVYGRSCEDAGSQRCMLTRRCCRLEKHQVDTDIGTGWIPIQARYDAHRRVHCRVWLPCAVGTRFVVVVLRLAWF